MLDEIWQNARSPSAMTLDLVTKASEAPNENEENVKPWERPRNKIGVYTIVEEKSAMTNQLAVSLHSMFCNQDPCCLRAMENSKQARTRWLCRQVLSRRLDTTALKRS